MLIYYILVLIVILLITFQQFKKRLFSWFINRFSAYYNAAMDKHKRAIFCDLGRSRPPRILEVGAGAGANFKYYPNCVLTCVDPNPYLKDYLEENKNDFPQVQLEKVIVGYGEDMKDLPDESFDVVVVTLVFCCVQDTEKVLMEVHRVLKPGGKFCFMEHVAAKPGTLRYWFQCTINPIWKFVFDGCNLNRDTGSFIKKAGFSKVDVKELFATLGIFSIFIGPHVYGTSIK